MERKKKETYSKICLKLPLSKRPKIGFQDQLSLNAGQKYSAIFSTFIKLPFVILDLCFKLFFFLGGGGGWDGLFFFCECQWTRIQKRILLSNSVPGPYSKNCLNEMVLLSTYNTCLN